VVGAGFGPKEFQALVGVSRETLERLETYAQLLGKWQRAINLVGPATLPDLWRRHFLDSAQLSSFLPILAGRTRRIADLGSGAGFPGLVLAILGCGEVHLVESDRRKAQFLREVSRETGARTRLHEARIEELSPLSADLVTARALAPLERLLDYVGRHLAPGGLALLPKGREAAAELTRAQRRWSMTVEQRPSLSDAEGSVLVIGDLVPKH